jgi:protein-tyrosine phosphatase
MELPTFVPVGGGMLALTHRPKKKALPVWADAGVSHVVTLLADSEGASIVGEAVTAAGLSWIWIALPNGEPPASDRAREIRSGLDEVVAALAAGGHVVMHCSAGIHRTGMMGHAVLRLAGLDAPQAKEVLRRLRVVTADGVGEHRLAWAQTLIPR